MSKLRLIYQLLREEYAVSRHIFWLDEAFGKVVNDVTYCLHLVRKAAECIRLGEDDCWRELAAYAVERSMSYVLVHAIGDYLLDCRELEPLPLVDLTHEKYRNWRGEEVPLLDESDPVFIKAPTENPNRIVRWRLNMTIAGHGTNRGCVMGYPLLLGYAV